MVAKFDLGKIKAKLDGVTKDFEGMVAQIGVPSGIQYEDGTTVATVAAIQEWGAPAMKIPPRPFFRPTIEKKQQYWINVIKAALPNVTNGSASAFDVLDHVGRVASLDIQETIAGIYSPPLSERTLAARRAKGNTSDKPLNDTGLMQASIRNGVAKEGDEFHV